MLERIDDEIDALEDAVLERPTDEQLQRIAQLKRDLVGLRRIVGPERDLFTRAGDDLERSPGSSPRRADYFRDLEDHLIRLSDTRRLSRPAAGAMDVYLSTVSNRLNVVMERLTIVATIFLPLTLLTGFFGMNFGWLVRHIQSPWAFWAFGLGGSLSPSLAIVWWIRRNRLT